MGNTGLSRYFPCKLIKGDIQLTEIVEIAQFRRYFSSQSITV